MKFVSALSLLAVAPLLAACSRQPTQAAGRKLIVVGVDRMDPGGHGIFDFVSRNPASRLPASYMSEVAEVPGVLLSNRNVRATAPLLFDTRPPSETNRHRQDSRDDRTEHLTGHRHGSFQRHFRFPAGLLLRRLLLGASGGGTQRAGRSHRRRHSLDCPQNQRPAAYEESKNNVWAALFELRVYVDEPHVTWRAQKALFAANFRYMALALRPALWMIAPMALLLVHLDSFYGRAPLPVDRNAIVTMGMSSTWDPNSPAPQLLAPPQVLVTSFAVRAPDVREISWRIRPVSAVSSQLTFLVDGQPVQKRIEAGSGQRFIPGRAVNSALKSLWVPERRIASDTVQWIEIRYPPAYLSVLGVQWSWLLWFFAVCIMTALLLKKRFGVVI